MHENERAAWNYRNVVLHIDFEIAILALERPWHVVFVPHISGGLFIYCKVVRIVSGFLFDMRNSAANRQNMI